jgi:hypothetical protein
MNTATIQVPSNVNVAIEVKTTGPEELRKRRYKSKCEAIQKQIKEVIFINAALQSEAYQCREKVNQLKIERKFLLNKLLEYEKEPKSDPNCKILQRVLSKKSSFLSP